MTTQQLSEFGKMVRIARIETGKTLKQMADFAGVSSAYLSAVEMGRKEITEKVVNMVATFLGYDVEETDRLHAAANETNGKVRINLESVNEYGVEAATLFARYSSSLSPEALQRISATVKEEVSKVKGSEKGM